MKENKPEIHSVEDLEEEKKNKIFDFLNSVPFPSPLLAPLALIPIALVALVLIFSNGGENGNSGNGHSQTTPAITPQPTEVQPTSIPKQKGKIVFARGPHIWRIETDGTQAEQLTKPGPIFENQENKPGIVSEIEWSPQKKNIAFILDSEPYLLNPANRETTPLTQGFTSNKHNKLIWSPDSKKLASEIAEGDQNKIRIYDSEGNTIQKIDISNFFPENTAENPSIQLVDWFPNNQELLVYLPADNQHEGFWQVDLDKNRREQLTTTSGEQKTIHADLDPAGQSLVYLDQNEIWLFTMPDKSERKLKLIPKIGTDEVIYSRPQFDPKGNKIHLKVNIASRKELYFSIYDIKEQNHDLFRTHLQGEAQSISWSPSSIYLTFSLISPSQPTSGPLIILNTINHQHFQITANANHPDWSPF